MKSARDAAPAVRALALLVVLAALAAPLASAHHAEQGIDQQLVKDGERLIVGSFTAGQPGPLILVPRVDALPSCAAPADGGATIALGNDSAVTFFWSDEGLRALVDLPPTRMGYVGIAVDTREASRALIMMTQNAVALHALLGVAWAPGKNVTEKSGVLGQAFVIPGTSERDHEHEASDTPQLHLDHDGSFSGASSCAGDAPGHRAFVFRASALPRSLVAGRVVHVVALYDPHVDGFPASPIENSTLVAQANLYLQRPGEDLAVVREALSPSWAAADVAPIALVALGVVWVSRR